MYGTPFKDGPEYVASSATNIYNPATNTYALIRHIRLANTSGSARTVSLYVGVSGGSAGGTQILGGTSIPANDNLDIHFPAGLRLTSADFLTGVASAGSTVTVTTTGTLHAA